MGRLRKVSHQDVPLVSSLESADSVDEAFVPNDFAEDGSHPDLSRDEGEFDKALLKFYLNQKVKCLKRKLSSASRRNVRQKQSTYFPTCSTFTRYSGKFFSGVVAGMCPRYQNVIQTYGMGYLLNFVRTEVPLRLVKWLASRFDVPSSEFQFERKFIPMTKYDIHNILDLPVDGEPLVSDPESGRDFILSHFNVSSIPPVSFFANKLKSTEVELSDEDIFICFMIVALSSFLCPNSSLSPSPKYLHIFRDCSSLCNYDLSGYVYEWLLSSIKKFKNSTKVASKRSVTFGGCHYAFVVCYLDQLNFGLHSVPDVKPWILAWRGNKVKQFSELDRNNSRSYGKRPLKRLFAPVNPQSIEKSSASKDGDVPLCSDMLFEMNVQKSFGARFGFEAAQVVINLVQSRNKDKPKLFVEWSQSLVIDVLECLSLSTLNAKSVPIPKVYSSEGHSLNKFSFGAKSVSIQSFIGERKCETVVEKSSPEVQQQIPNLNEASPFVSGVVSVGGFHNPVVLSSSSRAPKVCDEGVVNEANVEAAIPVADLSSIKSPSHSIGLSFSFLLFKFLYSSFSFLFVSCLFFSSPVLVSSLFVGISPSTTRCAIPVVGSTLEPSAGLIKKCEPKSDDNGFQRPTFAQLNRTLSVQSNGDVTNGEPNDKEVDNSFGEPSPLVPIRLSQRFHNALGDVECSQYVVERFMNSLDPRNYEDCVEMAALPNFKVSKSTHCSSHPTNEVKELQDDIQIVGTSSFAARCQQLSRSNDVAYNKLKNFTAPQSTSCNPRKQQAISSPEVEILSSGSAPRPPSAAPVPKAHAQSSIVLSGSSHGHVPRRMIVPGRYTSDPYVAQGNKFPVANQERRHHLAMVEIGTHETWCKFEAIRYDRAYCSYRNLATLKSKEDVDNFLILCVCRYLFKQSHPSASKKHFFFSYIGETILSGVNIEIVANAFHGANSAFAMWRSNLLFFLLLGISTGLLSLFA
ncbi:uncharacterized protein [Triticum aestivum]|uniref:uncharacterized protein isoform X2 n=1 Tax=Triticum aestivum TaxID=4565 RepID=UPI001D02DBED|nr:uncharacterized protein LOC123102572 isoform X2 [Triticum aestivum]